MGGLEVEKSKQHFFYVMCRFLFPFPELPGIHPFHPFEKRAKVVTSAKWSCSEIWVMISEVWRRRNVASISSNWLM